MAYSSGGLIEAADYNTFATNLNSIWGTGSTTSGWGQTAIGSVAASGVVTATNWATLVNNLASSGSQTNTTITSRTAPTTGTLVSIFGNVATDISSCTTNRGNAASSGTTSTTWTGSTAKTTGTPGASSQAAWTITWTHTVTFASYNQARYFFNAGGQLRLDMAKSSTGTSNDDNWNTFIASVGGIVLSGRPTGVDQTIAGVTYQGVTRIGGTGTPTSINGTTGYWQIAPSTSSTSFVINGTSTYAGEFVSVNTQVDATGSVITFLTVWSQPVVSGAGQSTDISGGTDTTSPFSVFGTAPAVICRYIPPSTSFLTNSWGTPTITASVV